MANLGYMLANVVEHGELRVDRGYQGRCVSTWDNKANLG